MADLYTLPRREAYLVEMLDRDDRLLGTLDGVEGGTLDWSIYQTIRTTGVLDMTATSQQIDWLTTRLRITYRMETAEGTLSWPLGVYLPAVPQRQHSATSVSGPVQLFDKLLILREDSYGESVTIAAGASITGTVDDLITATGETNRYIEPDLAVLRNPMTFEPGTTRLQIINALLEAAGYSALWCDGWGQYRAERYRPPAQRGLAWEFASGEASIHSPAFTLDDDYFSVPNRWTLVSRTDGDTPALTSTRTLDALQPTSRFTQANRGRWISRVDIDVEAASQSVLDAMCERRLLDAAAVTRSVTISHAMLPLQLNQRVTFADTSTELVELGNATITQTTIPLTPGGLMRTTLRGVTG